MNTEKNIRKDADSAIFDVERLRKDILEFKELHEIEYDLHKMFPSIEGDIANFKDRVAELLDRITELLQQISRSPKKENRPEDIFPLSTLAQELKAQVEWLEGMLTHLESIVSNATPNNTSSSGQAIKSAISTIQHKLLPFIKTLLSKLWSIISSLLTPKEWKLKGEVGAGLLGLTKVEVEVTFGK